jgi:DNA replication protein DnaC
LPTFPREYDKLARQGAAGGVDHVRYLVRLTELELIDRERRMIERRIRQARFPAVKRGSRWVLSPPPPWFMN